MRQANGSEQIQAGPVLVEGYFRDTLRAAVWNLFALLVFLAGLNAAILLFYNQQGEIGVWVGAAAVSLMLLAVRLARPATRLRLVQDGEQMLLEIRGPGRRIELPLPFPYEAHIHRVFLPNRRQTQVDHLVLELRADPERPFVLEERLRTGTATPHGLPVVVQSRALVAQLTSAALFPGPLWKLVEALREQGRGKEGGVEPEPGGRFQALPEARPRPTR